MAAAGCECRRHHIFRLFILLQHHTVEQYIAVYFSCGICCKFRSHFLSKKADKRVNRIFEGKRIECGLAFIILLKPQIMHSAFRLPSLYKNKNTDFIIIAHRGASAYGPENTMAAFEGAVELKADMIELDVSLSKDGVPVVIHDAELKRTTDGEGLASDYTLKELKKLDAGAWFGSSFGGQRIPALEQVLEFSAGKIALNIEIKTEAVSDKMEGGMEEKCLRLVRNYGMLEHVLFSSFNYRAVSRIKEMDPAVPAALVYERWQSGLKLPSRLIAEYHADAFNCSYRQLTDKRLFDLTSNDIPVFVYTVDQPARMEELIKKGVNGIFTNKPDVLRDVLKNLNQA